MSHTILLVSFQLHSRAKLKAIQLILYHLAGLIEYYTSHAAVIQITVMSTPPALTIVVNMKTGCTPLEVILVENHVDKVEKSRNVEEIPQMSASLQAFTLLAKLLLNAATLLQGNYNTYVP